MVTLTGIYGPDGDYWIPC